MIMMATTGWPDRVAMTACGRVADDSGRWPVAAPQWSRGRVMAALGRRWLNR